MKKKEAKQEEVSEWDLSKGMGIFPDDVALTQNIGCVGGKRTKQEIDPKKEKK